MALLDLTNSVIIPTLSDGTAYYTMRIALDSVNYTFDFKFSSRENVWYLDILDDDYVPLLLGIKLVPGSFLCEYQKEYRNLFGGDLCILTGKDADAPHQGLEILERTLFGQCITFLR